MDRGTSNHARRAGEQQLATVGRLYSQLTRVEQDAILDALAGRPMSSRCPFGGSVFEAALRAARAVAGALRTLAPPDREKLAARLRVFGAWAEYRNEGWAGATAPGAEEPPGAVDPP